MKKLLFVFLVAFSAICLISCGSSEDSEFDTDDSNSDSNSGSGNSGVSDGESNNGSDADVERVDEGGFYTECTPGDTRSCYEGPSGTEGVGVCKAGVSTCVEDGTDWSECKGQVLPTNEICSNGIDENCDGEDMTLENAVDYDGDGYNYCNGDCCETGWEENCSGTDSPERINPSSFEVPSNGVDDNCNGQADEVVSACDANIATNTTNPMDMAQSIDLCPVTEDNTFGVVSAKLLFPDGTEGEIPAQQHAVLTAYGNVLKPKAGNSFLAFSTGDLASTSTDTQFETSSGAPDDWFQANGGSSFPDSPACSGLLNQSDPGTPPVNDPVMLELVIRAPKNASAFGLGVYYISSEFPTYVCKFNDFFVMLLDTAFSTTDPNLQNPADKNIAMDSLGNPLGINLAKSGLFTVCCPRNGYPSCQGDEELKGTPFTLNQCPNGMIGAVAMDSAHGATGWLEVRGNIVPGEDFKLRMALWDTNDHALDSMVLLDNFTWYEVAGKPGIAPK